MFQENSKQVDYGLHMVNQGNCISSMAHDKSEINARGSDLFQFKLLLHCKANAEPVTPSFRSLLLCQSFQHAESKYVGAQPEGD